jgi:hypothetical protein
MKNGIEAARFLQDWSKWVVTVNTGAIGALGYFVLLKPTEKVELATQLKWYQQLLLGGTLSAFGFSLLFASWLLYALPGVVQRYSDESPEDIFLEGSINQGGWTIVFISACQHGLFVLGIFLFAAFATSFRYWGWTLVFFGIAVFWAVWLIYLAIKNPSSLHK